jgi:hypothetical protein
VNLQETRTRVSVYIDTKFISVELLLHRNLSMESKSEISVNLSLAEAKYISLSKAAREVIFGKTVVDSMGYKISFQL